MAGSASDVHGSEPSAALAAYFRPRDLPRCRAHRARTSSLERPLRLRRGRFQLRRAAALVGFAVTAALVAVLATGVERGDDQVDVLFPPAQIADCATCLNVGFGEEREGALAVFA